MTTTAVSLFFLFIEGEGRVTVHNSILRVKVYSIYRLAILVFFSFSIINTFRSIKKNYLKLHYLLSYFIFQFPFMNFKNI